VQATTRTWPGPAPCNTTLEACFNASAGNDTIVIATNTPIDESIGVAAAVSLVAGTGVKPRFAAGRILSFTPLEAGPWTLRVSSIAMDDGNLSIQMRDHGTVILEDIEARDVAGGFPIAVNTFTQSSGLLLANVIVRRCRLQVGGPTSIGIFVSAAEGAQLDAQITDNTIVPIGQIAEPTSGSGPTGINVRAFGAAAHRFDVQRNRVLPAPDNASPLARLAMGIVVSTIATSGSGSIRVADNVTVLRPGVSTQNAGVLASLSAASNDIRILNNTLVGGRNGVYVRREVDTANVVGRIDNNLVTLANFVGIFIFPRTLEPALGNASNLVFGNMLEDFAPGPGTVTTDPQLASVAQPRLTGASPARNAGDIGRRVSVGPGTLPTLPALDNDGLRRVKSTALDIGAFEFGDESILHNTTGFTNETTLNDPLINGNNALALLYTRSGGRTPGDTTPNPRPISQRYNTGPQRWSLLADDGFNINTGVGFSVFAPGSGNGLFTHTTAAANVSGQFSQLPGGSPNDAIYLISPTRGADFGGVANPHPIGASFQFGSWFVVNLDNAAMPLGSRFNVYWQVPSANAYVHTVDSGNQPNGQVSDLDHPLLNGNRCAVVHVSQNATVSINPHHVGVRYDSTRQRWYVRNEDNAALPLNTQFFVVVDAAASAAGCGDALFADGFETEV
jgi:hypothetical protein